jgi:glycosyltransferase involved in cell wall biosynthesis
MKVLIYSHFFAPNIGGVETIVLRLAGGLGEHPKDLSVTLVTQTPAGSFDDRGLSFKVVRQPSLYKLSQLVRSSNVVHVAGPALSPLVLSLLARKPVVVEHHGFQSICPNGQLLIASECTTCPGHFMNRNYRECLRCNQGEGRLASCKLWLLTFLRRFLCQRASANISPTYWLASLLQLPRITVIAHGLRPIPHQSRAVASPDTPVIAFQGRLVTTKGLRLLLEAARILVERNYSFRVLIIGEGPERSVLEEVARNSGLADRIEFAGRLDPDQLEVAISGAYAVAAPSLGGEVFGLVVAENMQRGLPVIASDLGAFVEVLGDGGLTFHTGEVSDLVAKLVQLLNNPALAAKLGSIASQRILDHYSEGRMFQDHLSLYRGLFNSR